MLTVGPLLRGFQAGLQVLPGSEIGKWARQSFEMCLSMEKRDRVFYDKFYSHNSMRLRRTISPSEL